MQQGEGYQGLARALSFSSETWKSWDLRLTLYLQLCFRPRRPDAWGQAEAIKYRGGSTVEWRKALASLQAAQMNPFC